MTKTSKYSVSVLSIIIAIACIGLYFLHSSKPDLPSYISDQASITVGGLERTYIVVLPEKLKPNPGVVFVFHPSQSNAQDMRRMVGSVLEPLAQDSNSILVYPDGFEEHFNDCRRVASYSARELNIDDVSFTESILQNLTVKHSVNSEKVFALGYSNGGHMALRLGLERPGLVRGVALIAANFPSAENMACVISDNPVSQVVFIEGTKDPINPYDGGKVTLFGFGDRGQVLSATESAHWFVDKFSLAKKDSKRLFDPEGLSATQIDWVSDKGWVRLVRVQDGGHTIPTSEYVFPRLFGSTFRSNEILTDVWTLFFNESLLSKKHHYE